MSIDSPMQPGLWAERAVTRADLNRSIDPSPTMLHYLIGSLQALKLVKTPSGTTTVWEHPRIWKNKIGP